MRPYSRIALALTAILSAHPAAAESVSLTEDEIRVQTAIMVEAYGETCLNLVGPVTAAMRREALRAEQSYVAINGRAAWEAALADARVEMARQVQIDTPYYHCALTNEYFVEYLALDTDLSGPSFPCSGTLAPAQQAICKEGPVAWGYDRAIAGLVADLEPRLNDKGIAYVADVLADGDTYIAKCGTREGCVTNNLQYRMQELSDLWLKVDAVHNTNP